MGAKDAKQDQAVPNGGEGRLRTPARPGRGKRLLDGDGPRITWEDIPSDDIRALVTDVNRVGGAIILGSTSDGGALSITILMGDDRIREWPTSAVGFSLISQVFRRDYVL